MSNIVLCVVVVSCLSIAHSRNAEHRQAAQLGSSSSSSNCKTCAINLIIVMDGSGSINETDFSLAKVFILKLVRRIYEPSKTRIGFIVFDDTVNIVLDLGAKSTLEELEKAVNATTQPGGGTSTHKAIQEAREMFQRTPVSSQDEYNVLLLITDGVSNDHANTVAEAQLTLANQITIVAIGVGAQINVHELELITGNPDFVQPLPTFSSLQHFMCNILALLCRNAEPAPCAANEPSIQLGVEYVPLYKVLHSLLLHALHKSTLLFLKYF